MITEIKSDEPISIDGVFTTVEVEQQKFYNKALEDLKFNLEEEKKTYTYNGHSLDTDKWLDSYLKSKLGLYNF